MSLEILISKYIDGELSREEDIYLRNLLKENPSAKQKFDSSVELHLEMLDDADAIRVPVELLRKTEDRIMMEIFKSAPVVPVYKIKNVKRFKFNYNSVAAAIIMFFFIGVLSISDSVFKNSDNYTDNIVTETPKPKAEVNRLISSNTRKNELRDNKAKMFKSKIINLKSYKQNVTEGIEERVSINNFNDAVTVELKKNSIANSSVTDENSNAEEAKENINADSEFYSKDKVSDDFSVKKQKINPAVNYNSIGNIPMNNMDNYSIEVKEIHLTSYISHDFLRSSLKTHENSPIMNYSQSISYAANESSRVGIEFGLTQFSYDVNKLVKVSNITAKGKTSVEVLDPTESGTSINIPVKIEQQEQLYWGSVFYEQTLFNFSNFSLIGRIGFGASNDGILGYSLVMANYSIYRGIYLTVGTEGRIFNTQIPSLGYNNATSSLSIVYGLHFQF